MSDKYQYQKYGMKGARVGQAVTDILSSSQSNNHQTTEDILDACTKQFWEEFEKSCAHAIKEGYPNPFYIFIFQHKEFWAENVVRNWFIPRQTPPHALDMIQQYPHHNKMLFMINPDSNRIHLCWNIPGYADCQSILKNQFLYDSSLVGYIKDALNGKLEKDSYEFERQAS